MLFTEICVNNSFIFSVSIITVLVLVPVRCLGSFLFRHNSLQNLYISFSSFVSVSSVVLGCFDYNHLAFLFGWKVPIFLYLASRLLY